MIKKINHDIRIKDIDLTFLRKILKDKKEIAHRLEENFIQYLEIYNNTNFKNLSFVLFLEVPQRMLDEAKRKPPTNVGAKPGDLCFLYGEESLYILCEKKFTQLLNTAHVCICNLFPSKYHSFLKNTRTTIKFIENIP